MFGSLTGIFIIFIDTKTVLWKYKKKHKNATKDEINRIYEAEEIYNKSKNNFIRGKITKDQLKEKLKPYKNELTDLGYVKILDEWEKSS